MAYEVLAEPALGIVRVRMAGKYEATEVAEMVTRARQEAALNGWNILYDMRAANPEGMAPADVFWLPRRVPSLRSPEVAKVRVATLHLPEMQGIAQFWENTFRNAGILARAAGLLGAAVPLADQRGGGGARVEESPALETGNQRGLGGDDAPAR
jgi:hypothetical protein